MKSLLLIASLLFSTPTPSQLKPFVHSEKIIVKYDKFADQTSVILWKVDLAPGQAGTLPDTSSLHRVQLSLVSSYEGKTAKEPKTVLAVFSYKGPREALFTAPTLFFLVDGKRMSVPTKWAEPSDLSERGTSEVGAELPFRVVTILASAKTAEVKLGIRECHLAGSNFTAVRDFLSRFSELTPM